MYGPRGSRHHQPPRHRVQPAIARTARHWKRWATAASIPFQPCSATNHSVHERRANAFEAVGTAYDKLGGTYLLPLWYLSGQGECQGQTDEL
jgi:hypothetical protein